MQTGFFDAVGKMAIGSRLRMLTARITDDAKKLYELYGVELAPKWFPVFYVLSGTAEKTITEIAQEIGHSQPSVSNIIREMAKKGLVLERRGARDGRQNLVRLSKKGMRINEQIQDQYTDVNNTVEEISSMAIHDLWKAIDEWEKLLEEKSLFQRVRERKKQRESTFVEIVPYEAKYRKAFQALNEEWIHKFFKMEAADRRALENPENYILNKGGSILVALYRGEPVGVCALLKMNDPRYDFELAKMAVSPKAQGKNIGYLLGLAAIAEARRKGASTIFLESNTILKPAINLYYKLGFERVSGRPSPYARSNIQMELHLGK